MLGCWGEIFEVQVSVRLLGVKYLRHKSVLDSWGERFEVQVSVRLLG